MYKMFQKYIVRISIVLTCFTVSFVTEENVDSVATTAASRSTYIYYNIYISID